MNGRGTPRGPHDPPGPCEPRFPAEAARVRTSQAEPPPPYFLLTRREASPIRAMSSSAMARPAQAPSE